MNEVKGWDKASKEVKLGAIGVLVKDEDGKVKTDKLGKRKSGTGALLGALVAVLSGGASLVGGALAGGVLGSFFHKGLGLSKDDLDRIGGELDDGKAAVVILAEPETRRPGSLTSWPSWAARRKPTRCRKRRSHRQRKQPKRRPRSRPGAWNAGQGSM